MSPTPTSLLAALILASASACACAGPPTPIAAEVTGAAIRGRSTVFGVRFSFSGPGARS
jgi:hypothetical protein